jgi:hypothetical protein
MGTADRVNTHFLETLFNLSLSVKDHLPFVTKVPIFGASSQIVTFSRHSFYHKRERLSPHCPISRINGTSTMFREKSVTFKVTELVKCVE